jgi:hypothetical protein
LETLAVCVSNIYSGEQNDAQESEYVYSLLIAVSAIGFLFFPSKMLAVVGIVSNEQLDFLLRTTSAALVALVPAVWAGRTSIALPASRAVLMGLVVYLTLSSLVDFYACRQSIVNTASIPSIAFRILLGSAILWLVLREKAKTRSD